MIIKELENKTFIDTKDKIKWLVENKEKMISASKGTIKHSDCISVLMQKSANHDDIIKTNKDVNKDELFATLIINTTNILDSHGDVHIEGIWDKCLAEKPNLMHIQEHQKQFDKIIADGEDLNVYVKTYNWVDLGYDHPGTTQALVFESNIKKARNEFMFGQYQKGYVKNHSVSMQYVNIELAVNDNEYKDEYAVWLKYIDNIVNKKYAESVGYFWAVTEANVFEGSAVPVGSNPVTPTLNIKQANKEIVVHEDEYYNVLHKLRANKISILKNV
ncbi:MAG: hypothetical protein LLG13_11045 [Bacteroidales bacterium]|nr:hypothetical protein [Bacteroidales bacterium]